MGVWLVWIRSTPHPVTVTTRIITFLVGNPYKPSFATVTGWGVDPRFGFVFVVDFCYGSYRITIKLTTIWDNIFGTFLKHQTVANPSWGFLSFWPASSFKSPTVGRFIHISFWRFTCSQSKDSKNNFRKHDRMTAWKKKQFPGGFCCFSPFWGWWVKLCDPKSKVSYLTSK